MADHVGGKALGLDLGDGDAVDALRWRASMPTSWSTAPGIQHVAPIEDFDPERVRALIHAVMLAAPFRLARALLPGMYARGWGRIVHVS